MSRIVFVLSLRGNKASRLMSIIDNLKTPVVKEDTPMVSTDNSMILGMVPPVTSSLRSSSSTHSSCVKMTSSTSLMRSTPHETSSDVKQVAPVKSVTSAVLSMTSQYTPWATDILSDKHITAQKYPFNPPKSGNYGISRSSEL